MGESETPAGLGVIGCGNVLDAYAPQWERLAREGKARCVLAAGREGQRDRALKLGVGRFVTDARMVVQDSDVNVVLVLTSMPEHAVWVRAALEAGKDVLVEKPLATDWDEACALVRLAQETGRRLACAPFTVLSPTFQRIREEVALGKIGRPSLARARYGWSGPWWSEWFYKPGGGCLLDLGVYSVTTLTGWLGPVRRVAAMLGVGQPEREINGKRVRVEAEDQAQVLLEFENGAMGVVTTGFTMQQYRSPALELYGTDGVVQMMGDDWDPDGYELWQNSVGAWQVYKETAPEWSWTEGLAHLVECRRRRVALQVTPEHALHVLEILLKAQQASREGRTIGLESRFDPGALIQSGDRAAVAAHRVHDRTRVERHEGGVLGVEQTEWREK